MHLARSFDVLLFSDDPRLRPLDALDDGERTAVHALASKLVLATDMARHVELLDAFKCWAAPWSSSSASPGVVAPCEPTGALERSGGTGVVLEDMGQPRPPRCAIDERGKVLVLQMLLKAADLSNAFRDWKVSCPPTSTRFRLMLTVNRASACETGNRLDLVPQIRRSSARTATR
eukprot:TRINITY_DN3690_c0_g1_i6.p1 TRINITY_DN3690_c0_g1~~TRINITY_DN3690_c0_g1_i6.p1  ORF type:complete len:175 (+),score=20.61 TRINITY_DN3690_c0_g1_i6:207-731(+)